MLEFIHNFHFLRPLILLLFFIPMVMLFFIRKNYQNMSSWEKVCDLHLLQYLLIKGSGKQRKKALFLAVLGMLGAFIAAAGPAWQKTDIPAVYAQNPIIFALNLSTDMNQEDLKPSRINRAKYAISDILSACPDVQSGLIAFSNEPFLISPISEDGEIIKNLLPAVTLDIMPVNGNRIDRAIDYATQKLRDAEFYSGNIIIITADSGTNASAAIKSAQAAAKNGYKINIIEASTDTNEILQQIAKAGKGKYIKITNDIEPLISEINNTKTADMQASENLSERWNDAGYYLLIIPLICCLLLFRRGIFIITLIVFYSNNVSAAMFLNRNQEGLKEFQQQNYEEAAEKFDDANWQASALYKAEKFDDALKIFAQDSSETGLYNQGNALAKSGKINDAIKKYEEVLSLNPQNEDAKFNLEYLKQQKQNMSSSSKNNNDNNQNQQNNESSSAGGQEKNNDQKDSDEQSSSGNEQTNENNESDEQNGDDADNQSEDLNQSSISAPQEAQNSDEKQENSNDSVSGNSGENSNESPEKQQENSQNFQDAGEEQTPDKPISAAAQLQNADKDTKSNEEIMARAQQYRAIEDDPGGLLRAFIRSEYQKNRYKEQQ